ncbi:MAG TPA: glycosyltransferase family 9 protein [Ktedonobacteraceae bacterium]|nr:glycosyltransferase family 9 protein [Ktedonobacteraceae bacterium]
MFAYLGERIPDVRKIAVLRANALGDFIFVLPALEALRATYPQAEIVLLAKAWHQSFLQNRPGPLNRVIPVPLSTGVNEEPDMQEDQHELARFFAAMQEEHFDLALQLHGGGLHSNPFLLQLGARLNVGLKTPDAVPLDRWIPYVYFQSEIFRYLEVVSLVGATPVILEPRVAVTAADLEEASHVVPQQQRPLVALHPGSGDVQRRWPPEKFAAVGDALARAGAQIVVTGTESERQVVEQVVRSMKNPAQNLCNALSLGGLAGLYSRCRVVISNDSGPLHLAAAVGASTVGIFWCFNLYTAGLPTRRRHRPFVSWQVQCPICGSDRVEGTCEHRPSFVANIPTHKVIDAVFELLTMSEQT